MVRFRRRYIFIKLTIVVIIILLICFMQQGISNKIMASITQSHADQLKNEYSNCEVIHIGVVCTGYDYILHFYTMLKSLYYFRNNPLHFHIVVDNISGQILKTLFKTWTVPQVDVSFYDVHTLVSGFGKFEYQYYPAMPFSKLLKFTFLKVISRDIANKIIVIDPDIFLVSDIRNLWNEFDNFSKDQVVGFLKYQINGDLKSKKSRHKGKRIEYKSEIIFYNLKKTSKIVKFLNIVNDTVVNSSKAYVTDQDIIHAILKKKNYQNLVYHISSYVTSQLESNYNNTKFKIIGTSEFNSHPLNISNDYTSIYQTIVNYDGSLSRDRMYECMENSDTTTFVNFQIDNCSDFHETENHEWRKLLFIREFRYNVTEDDITFVSQLSYSRRKVLEELGKFWEGPMSLTIYVTDSELHEFITFIRNSTFLQNRFDIAFHAVFKDGDSHPINVLRNVALHHVRTPYVFLVDIDFVPMPNLYSTLKTYLSNIQNMEKKALIVPAFETKKILPETKNELLKMMDNGTLLPFHQKVFRRAHAPTNFQKWRLANDTYQVLWKPNFEPYVVVRSNVTEYDERFFGYGWNKVSHIYELKAQGYEFLVLPNVYIVHKAHKFSDDRHKFIKSRKHQRCLHKLKLKFVKEINKKYRDKRSIKEK